MKKKRGSTHNPRNISSGTGYESREFSERDKHPRIMPSPATANKSADIAFSAILLRGFTTEIVFFEI
jgi:hypothetical protein